MPTEKPTKNKSLPIVNDTPVAGMTCFAAHAKYDVKCQRKSCSSWIDFPASNNCVMIAAREGPKTLQEIGEIFNLTRMRICQIEKSILEKIKRLNQ